MTEKKTWTEDHDDLLNDVDRAREQINTILDHLDCASSCETLEDFRANINRAEDDTDELLNEVLRPLKKWAKTFKV